MNITGTILKKLRLKRNITLDQLASELNELFNINLTGSMLSKWETGKAAPVYDHLKRLASYYDVTTDFLLGFDQYENLTTIDSESNLDINNKKIRYSKKQNNIKIVAELLEDDEVTNKDVIFIQNFIKLFKSRKDKNLYR
jgi:transcriptional regulator with XRE-family HTH domain